MSEKGGHHIVPAKVYASILGALLFLTFITVWVAQFDFGFANMIVAMGVATLKALLVMAFFMHLKYEGLMPRVIIGNGFFFFTS